MKDENRKIKEAKAKGESYEPKVFSNGDTLRQLLARSRYLLFKAPDKWLQSQKVRAKLLFEQFPDIKSVYYYALRLGKILVLRGIRFVPDNVRWPPEFGRCFAC